MIRTYGRIIPQMMKCQIQCWYIFRYKLLRDLLVSVKSINRTSRLQRQMFNENIILKLNNPFFSWVSAIAPWNTYSITRQLFKFAKDMNAAEKCTQHLPWRMLTYRTNKRDRVKCMKCPTFLRYLKYSKSQGSIMEDLRRSSD